MTYMVVISNVRVNTTSQLGGGVVRVVFLDLAYGSKHTPQVREETEKPA